MAEHTDHNSRYFLVLGLVLNGFDWFFDNVEAVDFYFGFLLKITSFISFIMFVFLNWGKLKKRFKEVFKK